MIGVRSRLGDDGYLHPRTSAILGIVRRFQNLELLDGSHRGPQTRVLEPESERVDAIDQVAVIGGAIARRLNADIPGTATARGRLASRSRGCSGQHEPDLQ